MLNSKMTKSPYYPCLPFTSPKMYPNQKKKKKGTAI